MTDIEPRFEMGYYVISPEEADQIGLEAVAWYAMPAVRDGQMFTSITAYPEAVNIAGRAGEGEHVPDAEEEWMLSVVATVQGTPADWKRPRLGW